MARRPQSADIADLKRDLASIKAELHGNAENRPGPESITRLAARFATAVDTIEPTISERIFNLAVNRVGQAFGHTLNEVGDLARLEVPVKEKADLLHKILATACATVDPDFHYGQQGVPWSAEAAGLNAPEPEQAVAADTDSVQTQPGRHWWEAGYVSPNPPPPPPAKPKPGQFIARMDNDLSNPFTKRKETDGWITDT